MGESSASATRSARELKAVLARLLLELYVQQAEFVSHTRARLAQLEVAIFDAGLAEHHQLQQAITAYREKLAARECALGALGAAINEFIAAYPNGRDGVRRDVVATDPALRARLRRGVARRDRWDRRRRRYGRQLERRLGGRPRRASSAPKARPVTRTGVRARARRPGASSSTSGCDPGEPPSPPELRPWRRPRTGCVCWSVRRPRRWA